MSQAGLERFGAYQKSMELFDLVVVDMSRLSGDGRCYKLISQQVGSADSICANIEEGYGRLSRAEYVRFLDFARASARETRGRYRRLHHWLNADIVQERVSLVDEIISILTSTINTLRNSLSRGKSQLKEDTPEYAPSPLDTPPSTLDTLHSPLDTPESLRDE